MTHDQKNRDNAVFGNVSWPRHLWFRSNILLDHQGLAQGPDGTSRSLTRGRDRALLRALRQDAEVSVTGGATVRAEGWHFPPSGYLLVASSGTLPVATCPIPTKLRVFSFDNFDDESLFTVVTALAQEVGARRLLCESGVHLLRALLRVQAIDEAFVSVVTPTANAGDDAGADAEAIADRALGLHSSGYELSERVTDSDVTFLRFLRGREKTASAS